MEQQVQQQPQKRKVKVTIHYYSEFCLTGYHTTTQTSYPNILAELMSTKIGTLPVIMLRSKEGGSLNILFNNIAGIEIGNAKE